MYFTYFSNQQNPALLQGAADLMIAHDVYLTDSLTASEAFALNFGGNQANFDQFITRRGVDIQAFDIVSSWRNFFNSNTFAAARFTTGAARCPPGVLL